MLDTTLLVPAGCGRYKSYVLGATVRVSTPAGNGTVRYLVSDGYAGVELDNELTVSGKPRVDEYRLGQLGEVRS